MKIKSIQVDPKRVKAGPQDDLKEGEFIVYPSTFIREPDAYGDVVAKGAFERTIKEWAESGNVLPGLFGHRMDDPDFYVAAATEMGEDEHGWWVKGEFDLDSPKGAQVYRLVKGRRLSQLSFAYDVRDEGSIELDDGRKATELRDLRVHEFSFVPLGANQDTSVVAVKGLLDHLKSAKSADSVAALIEARDSINSVLSSLDDVDGEHQEEKASGDAVAESDASTDTSVPAPDEAKQSPSVARLAAQAHIYMLSSIEGVTP